MKYRIVKIKKNCYTIEELVKYPAEKFLCITLRKAYKQWGQSGWYGPYWTEYESDFRPYYFKSKKKARKTIKRLKNRQRLLFNSLCQMND